MIDGHWEHDMGPGCAANFATLFGYTAGARHARDDLTGLGEVTAAGELASLREALKRDGPADWRNDSAAHAGIPALMVSGSMGGQIEHLSLAIGALDQLVRQLNPSSASFRNRTLLAVALAEAHSFDPGHEPPRIDAARALAQAAEPGNSRSPYVAMAWTTIAGVSREPADRNRAYTLVYRLLPKATVRDGESSLTLPYADTLSFHLALIHALGDIYELDSDPEALRNGVQLLDYVFSDAYFDGHFLLHDARCGGSERFCSGCNFWALYLADRFYGESLIWKPIGAPSVR